MGDEKIFTARFKIEDDGSIVLDKISGKLVDVGTKGQESLGKISSSLSIIKLDSLINLGERAFHTGQRIYNMAKQTASAIMEIERMSKISGLASDTYQKLAYAAKMSDVEVESLTKGMKILAGHMDDVSKGKAEAVSLFESIGVSIKDASGKMKSFDGILGDLADRFKSMPDGVQKVALATDLFGRSGLNLIPMLNKGKEGLREFYEEAEKLGIVLDEKLIKKGTELEDRLKRAEAWWSSFFKKIVVGAYEAIEAMQKYHSVAGMEISMTKGLRKKEEKPEGEWPSESRFISKETITYARQSEEAIKAIAKALEQAGVQEAKLNAFFADDAELLKQANREVDRRNEAMRIVSELGVKTKAGAETEIEKVMEEFKLVMGAGLSKEELTSVREKMVAQLEVIRTKYASFSGWMEEEFEEGRVKWIHSIPKDELTKSVEDMVNNAVKDIERMQTQLDAMSTRSNKIWIDTSEFANANSAIDTLRIKLETMTERAWPVHIAITGSGSSELPIMEKIQEIYAGFSSLPEGLRGLAVDISVKGINEQIYALQNEMARLATIASPLGWRPGAYSKYRTGMLQPQLENLMTMQQLLQAYQGQGGQEGEGYATGGGGISINIGTINVSGQGSAEIAQQLDEELTILWENNRSKLKRAIQG